MVLLLLSVAAGAVQRLFQLWVIGMSMDLAAAEDEA
jgi:hypothetical protein